MAVEQLKGSARYLSFPFRISRDGANASARADHVREQIANIVLTSSGDRVFLKDFGIGAPRLLFLAMTPQLWSRVEAALAAGVADALKGEAEPGSIQVRVGQADGEPERLNILVRYKLSALNQNEELTFTVSNGVLEPPKRTLGV